MQSIGRFFADNSVIVALANIGGVVAFCLLCWTFSKSAYRFGKDTYNGSIKSAYKEWRSRSERDEDFAATDLHIFLALIVRKAGLIAAATIPFSVSQLMSSTAPGSIFMKPIPGTENWRPLFVAYEQDAFNAMAIFALYLNMLLLFSLINFVGRVGKKRLKILQNRSVGEATELSHKSQ